MRTVLFLTLFLCAAQWAQGQSTKQYLTFDFQLVVDNDAFTGDITRDQYYSSGIYPMVRHLLDSSANAKRIRTYQLNHRLYTPSWIGWNRLEQLDRPYAGQISASVANEYYFHSNQYVKAQLELGVMGPASLLAQTQETWHRWFGMPEPRGWEFQIQNTPIINLYLTYARPFYTSYHFELSAESNAAVGTVYNYFRQDLMVRMGELRRLHQSAFYSSDLGQKRQLKKPHSSAQETYFFYSPGLEYVLYNATLEGNLIGESSPHTVEATPWVWQHRAGIMFSWPRFDFGLTATWRSPENPEARKHGYVGVRLNQRF